MSILKYFIIAVAIGTIILLATEDATAAGPALIPFQASGFRLANGSLISSSNVTLYVYYNTTSGTSIYNETFPSGLSQGYISVTMGNNTTLPLDLNWSQIYWLALEVNGTPVQMIDTFGVSSYRMPFRATQGEIVALTTLNTTMNSLYTNVSNLQTSNTSIWTQLGLISSNFTSFTLSNTSIWNYITNNYVNVSNLQTSNTTIWNNLNPMYVNVSNLQNSNRSIWGNYTNLYNNVTSMGNSTLARAGYAVCSSGQVMMNVTSNSSGIYANCTTDQTGSGSSYSELSFVNYTYLNYTVSTASTTTFFQFNMTLYLYAGRNLVECVFIENSPVATTGIQFQFNTTNSARIELTKSNWDSTTAHQFCQGTSATSNTCSATAAGTANMNTINKMVMSAYQSSAGTLTMGIRAEVAGTVLLKEGSYCKVIKLP